MQHFWSLSVEEQFYLFWPLLIIVALWIAARRGAARRVVLALLGAVTVASFVHSLVLTDQDVNLAYFSTLSRTWEFGVGGILAIVRGTAVAATATACARSWRGSGWRSSSCRS